MLAYLQYLGGAFLGWSLGANDSANVFGTAVSSRMVSYRVAVVLTAIFVVVGALMQGQAGIRTYSEGLRNTQQQVGTQALTKEQRKAKAIKAAMIISFAAALTVTFMTLLKIPVSTSQAAVGAIIGIGIMQRNVNLHGLAKVVTCWIFTPIGGATFTIMFYFLFKAILRRVKPTVATYDPAMRFLLVACGCYGAYALGANNVANVSAVFVGDGMLTIFQAALFGGIAIAFGALTYSKSVMMTVGKGIIALDSFTAFVCVLSHAITVHIFAMVGVPVSTSQAIVGAILGIGVIRGAHIINYKKLLHVSAGWMATPFIAGTLAAIVYYITHLSYTP